MVVDRDDGMKGGSFGVCGVRQATGEEHFVFIRQVAAAGNDWFQSKFSRDEPDLEQQNPASRALGMDTGVPRILKSMQKPACRVRSATQDSGDNIERETPEPGLLRCAYVDISIRSLPLGNYRRRVVDVLGVNRRWLQHTKERSPTCLCTSRTEPHVAGVLQAGLEGGRRRECFKCVKTQKQMELIGTRQISPWPSSAACRSTAVFQCFPVCSLPASSASRRELVLLRIFLRARGHC